MGAAGAAGRLQSELTNELNQDPRSFFYVVKAGGCAALSYAALHVPTVCGCSEGQA